MAKLSQLTADAATEEGDWVSPGLEYDDLEIRTRGYTDKYQDALRSRLFVAAKRYSGQVDRIPEADRREIGTKCLMQHVTLGIRNLQHEDGRDVTFEDLKVMVHEPKYRPLLDACYAAANIVQSRREADLEIASGNSAPPSA
jgi:hypothetical protein